MTGRRKAQLEICKIGKVHGYLGIGYSYAAEFTNKIGMKRLAKCLGFRAWTHATTAAGMALAAVELYPNEDEHS